MPENRLQIFVINLFEAARRYYSDPTLNLNIMEKYNELINSSKVVLVEFYASWCPHCQAMMPVVADVKTLLEGRAGVYQFDIDENRELADKLGIDGIPTFILYSEGKPVWTSSGEMKGNALLQKVEEYL